MKRHQESKTVAYFLSKHRMGKLILRPDFQRDLVWTKSQQRMLIDTILKDMDIPKIYIREVSGEIYEYEVVDGQQRLQSVIDFCSGKFKTESIKINDKEISVNYDGLEKENVDMKLDFDNYQFSVVTLRDTSDEEVEEMFLRLQSGTSLNAQEKRNAKSGKMRDFIRELAEHEFFLKCGFNNRRFAYAHIASQMTILELHKGMYSIRGGDLDKMYEDQKKFDTNSTEAKEIHKTLSYLSKAFTEKRPELEKHNAISMFLLLRYLRKNYDIKGREEEIGSWFIKFEQLRKDDMEKPTDERDSELIEYQGKTVNTTDAVKSLKYRQEVLRVRLLSAIPDMELLDSQRNFTDDQRRAIWCRDRGICQVADKCNGIKLEWDDNWHADHKKPYARGGKTSVENGQVACAECNLAKGAKS